MKEKIKSIIKKFLPVDYCRTMLAFHHDAMRIVAHSAAFNPRNKVTAEAQIILRYHILEKGITMPNRHVPFGKKIAKELVELVDKFETCYGVTNQVFHAVKVLTEYYDIHRRANVAIGEEFNCIDKFLAKHHVDPSTQLRFKRESYYEYKNKSFPEFANWRHTIRNYSSASLDEGKIRKAVQLAISAPSACSRQHIRVHCVSDKLTCGQILELQGGNRGFGHLADKVLIVTADLRAEIGGIRERYDPYVNGGIFLMNLCYALSYCEVAYCILTCSLERDVDAKIRSLGQIPENEVVVAMLCCGEPPADFNVPISPKRDIDEVLSFIR